VNRATSVLLLSLALVLPASAQRYVYPAKKTPAPCTNCLGKNAFGVANKNLPTWPYDVPFVRHTGRYVDSTTTGNVQNLGIRTVRAGTVRVNKARNKIYITLGEAVGGYPLDTFFSSVLARPMIPVSGLPVGKVPSGRLPLELVAKPDSLFYAESPFSGWVWEAVDTQRVLTDFDSDDRGIVYAGTYQLGWGLARDLSRVSGVAMEYLVQVESTPHVANTVIALKTGGKYYAVVSQNTAGAGMHTIYDVSRIPVPAAGPQPIVSRPTAKQSPLWTLRNAGIVTWAKYDASERLAILDTAGHVRIFDYAAFVNGGAPRVDFAPSSTAKQFTDLAFDESGVLWLAEGPGARYASVPTINVLYRAAVSGATYVKAAFNAYGGAFAPQKIAAGGGYVVVAGRAPDAKGVLGSELRLFRATGAAPRLVPTGDFIRRYYDAAPAGYADPGPYVGTWGVSLIAQGTTTYLLYSAGGLGDVYELPPAF